MLSNKLRLITLIFSLILVLGMGACADPIDDHNIAFRTIIEELQNRIIVLEDTGDSSENYFIYPQKWATGDGTVDNPWANDCIQKAYDIVPDDGIIYLRAGYYLVSATIGNAWTQTKSFSLIGEGIGRTILTMDTGDTDGIAIFTADNCKFKGFTIDADCQGDDTRPAISIYKCNYTIVEDVEAKNAGTFGIDFAESSYSYVHNVYAHDNYEHGIHPGADIQGRNTNNVYRDIYCYNNGVDGFDDYGYPGDVNNNIYDNLHCWNNTSANIAFQQLNNCTLSNSYSHDGGNYGIYQAITEDWNVSNCIIKSNAGYGYFLNNSDNVSLVNVISKNNDGNAGMYVNDSNGIKLTSCQSYDDRAITLQEYGLEVGSDITIGLNILSCKLMPNKVGDIYNPVGVIINKWPVILSVNIPQLRADLDALITRIRDASEAININ